MAANVRNKESSRKVLVGKTVYRETKATNGVIELSLDDGAQKVNPEHVAAFKILKMHEIVFAVCRYVALAVVIAWTVMSQKEVPFAWAICFEFVVLMCLVFMEVSMSKQKLLVIKICEFAMKNKEVE